MEVMQIINHLPYDSAFALKSCEDINYGYIWRGLFSQIKLKSSVEISASNGKYTQEIIDFLDGNGFQIIPIVKLYGWTKYKVVPL